MRTLERRVFHYEVETALADRLRSAAPHDRSRLYGAVYDELFRRVPDHPQNRPDGGGLAERERARSIDTQVAFLKPRLTPEAVLLELGAGDARLSSAVAPLIASAYAADVSEVVLRGGGPRSPRNLLRVTFDGLCLPLRDSTVDVVFSNQLIEHLHPDDTATLIGEAYRVLKPGGACFCITPNRVDGPHDISNLFDDVARGFHLKEYTTAELFTLFRGLGFTRTSCFLKLGRRYLPCPSRLRMGLEWLLLRLPRAFRRALVTRLPLRALLPHYIRAEKPAA